MPQGYVMSREVNLRQIEAFKAVIENGTVSRAAEIFNISQPAMSKLIVHLEFDTGLRLFDRVKGRLIPTEHAMRLYEEIDRIFSGVRQVESAVELIRREEQGHLAIGVMPALSGAFIQRATTSFLASHPPVFCSVQSRNSEWIIDWLITRKLDVGIVSARMENPLVESEPLMEHPLVCILPPGHPLTAKLKIGPRDLQDMAFLAFGSDTYGGQRVAAMFEANNVQAKVVLVANTSPTICEFVAAGLGVSLVHPLMVSGWEKRLVMRKFEPAIRQEFRVVRSRDSRNARLVQAYVDEMHAAAATIYEGLFEEG
jgi:DNA-binding transcriptional LysR family regulator